MVTLCARASLLKSLALTDGVNYVDLLAKYLINKRVGFKTNSLKVIIEGASINPQL